MQSYLLSCSGFMRFSSVKDLICVVFFMSWYLYFLQEENLRDKPGYEHLNEPLHVLLEAEFPADIIDARLRQAVNILEDLLKPVVHSRNQSLLSPTSTRSQACVNTPVCARLNTPTHASSHVCADKILLLITCMFIL